MKTSTILYIDDDNISHILVSEALSDKDIEIVHATSGLEAINLFRQNPFFDLVIVELTLPDIDGFDVLEEIKRVNPVVPVITLSAVVLDDTRNISYSKGSNLFMAKPIPIEFFVCIVEKFVGTKITVSKN